MAKGRKKKSKKPKKRWRTRTWVVGYARLPLRSAPPGSVPMLALVVEQPEGYILASEFIDAAEGGGGPMALVDLVAHAMEEPAIGPPRRPDRFLVAREPEHAALDGAFGLPVSVGSTAVLERIAKEFAAHEEELPGEGEPVDRSYFEDGVTPEHMAALFEVAARLYRLAPWKHLTVDMPVRLHAPHVGLNDAVVAVLGADRVTFALLLFASEGVYEEFIAETSQNRPPTVPLEALNWDPASELPKTMRKQAMRHGWPVADRDAYPWVLVRDRDGALPTRPKAIQRSTVAALAMIELCQAFENAPQEAGELTFEALGGPVEVSALPSSLSVATVEQRLLQALTAFAHDHYGDLFDDAFGYFDSSLDAATLGLRRLVYDLDTGAGTTVADELVARWGEVDRLTQEVLDAQRAAGVGLWEVRSIVPDEAVVLWETLSERRAVVQNAEAAATLTVGASILARVAQIEGDAFISGVHPQPLAPAHAAAVVAKMRKRLRRKSAVPVERLRESKHVDALIRAFVEAKAAQGADAPPRLWEEPPSNTDSAGIAAIQQFKDRHYREWLDIPVPALGDRTPREVARTKLGRAALVELIDSMEEGELTLPAEERYDFGVLRRELGLD